MLGTDGAVAVQCVLKAHMVIENGQVDAAATLGAVLVVDAETLAHTAQSAVLAVEDGLVRIRKQVTNVTIVLCQLLPTLLVLAELSTRLHSLAVHAHHSLDGISIDFVGLVSIVAQATCVILATARCTNLGLTRVMSAA